MSEIGIELSEAESISKTRKTDMAGFTSRALRERRAARLVPKVHEMNRHKPLILLGFQNSVYLGIAPKWGEKESVAGLQQHNCTPGPRARR